MSKTITYLIAIIVIAGILYVGYTYFLSSGVGDGEMLSRTQAGNVTSGQEFLDTLTRLKEINLTEQKNFFSDESFRTLKDSSVVLPEEPVGRANPFLPIGKEAPQTTPVTPVTSTAPGTPTTPTAPTTQGIPGIPGMPGDLEGFIQ